MVKLNVFPSRSSSRSSTSERERRSSPTCSKRHSSSLTLRIERIYEEESNSCYGEHEETSRDLQQHQLLGLQRFAYGGCQRPLEDQRAGLSVAQRKCVDNLKTRWENKNPNVPFSDEMYLRFSRCSPGPKPFNEKTAWRTMKNFDHRFLSLTAEGMEDQLMSKVCSYVEAKGRW